MLDVLTLESETDRASEDGVDGDDAEDDVGDMVITECAGVGAESNGEFVTSTLVQSGLSTELSNSSALLSSSSPSSPSIPKASSSAALSDATV